MFAAASTSIYNAAGAADVKANVIDDTDDNLG